MKKRDCPRCLNPAVVQNGYCGICRDQTLPPLVKPPAQATSRELEIAQLEMAVEKTKLAQIRADATLDALHDKLASQEAELRFQKLMARMDRQMAAGEVK